MAKLDGIKSAVTANTSLVVEVLVKLEALKAQVAALEAAGAENEALKAQVAALQAEIAAFEPVSDEELAAIAAEVTASNDKMAVA